MLPNLFGLKCIINKLAEAEKSDLRKAVEMKDTKIGTLELEINKLVIDQEKSAKERIELEIKCT